MNADEPHMAHRHPWNIKNCVIYFLIGFPELPCFIHIRVFFFGTTPITFLFSICTASNHILFVLISSRRIYHAAFGMSRLMAEFEAGYQNSSDLATPGFI
jgi:hypothetical protein